MVIDFGCAKELEPDGTLTIARQHLRAFTLQGNQNSHAPELFIEREAAMREAGVRWLVACCSRGGAEMTRRE